MAQYTTLHAYQVQEIAKSFGLEAIEFQPLTQGIANSNFVVNTKQGKFILTVCENNPQNVAQMCNVLLLLEEHDFPAARIRPFSPQTPFAIFQDKPILMKPYIEGQIIPNLATENLQQVGAALARLHDIPAPTFLPRIHSYEEHIIPQIMGQGNDLNYKKWVGAKQQAVLEKTPPDLPIGLVHGDLFWDNVLFEANQFKALIDFESICHIIKIFDIGMAVVGLCKEDTDVSLSKASALVSGYQQIRQLVKAEKDCLQMYIEWTAVLTSAWRFWKYNIDSPGINAARTHQEMVEIAEIVSAIPHKAFYEAVFAS
jgi:homoserine kinase type II